MWALVLALNSLVSGVVFLVLAMVVPEEWAPAMVALGLLTVFGPWVLVALGYAFLWFATKMEQREKAQRRMRGGR